MKANISLFTAETAYMFYGNETLACATTFNNLFKENIAMNALKTLLSD